jgi:hypothetical protein
MTFSAFGHLLLVSRAEKPTKNQPCGQTEKPTKNPGHGHLPCPRKEVRALKQSQVLRQLRTATCFAPRNHSTSRRKSCWPGRSVSTHEHLNCEKFLLKCEMCEAFAVRWSAVAHMHTLLACRSPNGRQSHNTLAKATFNH